MLNKMKISPMNPFLIILLLKSQSLITSADIDNNNSNIKFINKLILAIPYSPSNIF